MTDSDQRIVVAIPSPRTELSIGQFLPKVRRDGSGQKVTSQYSGVSLYTDQHVRFNASGAWSRYDHDSDLIAQATGQLWLQALGKVVGFAGTDMLISSPSATMIAGQGGVTILAGFRPGPPESEPAPGTFPKAVEAYETKAKIPTILWTVVDTVMALGLTALEAYLTVSGGPIRGTGYDGFGVMGAMANVVGASINIAALSESPDVSLPSINLFSQAGTIIATPVGALNLTGVPGLLLGSTFTTQFALIASGVRGLFRASMISLQTADIAAIADVTVRASRELMLASRIGKTTLRGVRMKVGDTAPKTKPQLPTAKLKLAAWKHIALQSQLKMKLATPGRFEGKSGGATTFDGGRRVRFKTGGFEIHVRTADTTLGAKAGAKVTLTKTGAKAEGAGGIAKAKLEPMSIELSAGAGSCKFDLAGKKLTVDGTTFDIK